MAKSSNDVELIKKIAPKTVMETEIKVPKKAELLYTVYGVATGSLSGESQYGTWEAFTGTFEAVRASDGKVFQSPKCFLPEPAFGMIKAGLKGHETEGVQFALLIGIKPSVREPDKKYEYTVTPVVKPEQSTLLSDLREQATKALPAPSR